jgi:Domain of unknown function (DUF1338)
MDKSVILQEVLAGLMGKYMDRVPDVTRIIEAMKSEDIIEKGSEIENDHIAFRTLGVAHLGIQSLEKIFIHFGYIKRDYYFFPEKKLNAWWYAPPVAGLPRIFISELRVKDLSLPVQTIISSYTKAVHNDPVDGIDLMNAKVVLEYLHSSSWRLPKLADYMALAEESEYAAWAIYNRYYLNHFTMSVHNLKKGYNTLAEFNTFLENHHIRLNDSGGKIKQSPDGLLLQSSTVAELVMARFEGGEEKMIPGSYVEFAERRNGREGFEAANANRIFESTYLEQVDKRP